MRKAIAASTSSPSSSIGLTLVVSIASTSTPSPASLTSLALLRNKLSDVRVHVHHVVAWITCVNLVLGIDVFVGTTSSFVIWSSLASSSTLISSIRLSFFLLRRGYLSAVLLKIMLLLIVRSCSGLGPVTTPAAATLLLCGTLAFFLGSARRAIIFGSICIVCIAILRSLSSSLVFVCSSPLISTLGLRRVLMVLLVGFSAVLTRF